MKTPASARPFSLLLVILILLRLVPAHAQVLLNVDFGAGSASGKVGHAGTGLATNDFWNLYTHYNPRMVPGRAFVPDGFLASLKFADKSESAVSLAVTNAPGVWGNTSGDPMFDSYIYAHNGSNISLTLRGLEPGSYHFFLYGHADKDGNDECNSAFSLQHGTNKFALLHDPPRRQHDDPVHRHQGRKPARWFLVRS